MERRPVYPEIVETNIPWLGQSPRHWKVHQLKRAVTDCVNGLWGDEADGVNDIAVIRVADFDRVRSRVNVDEYTVRSIPIKDRRGRLLNRGDLLIEKSGGGEKQLVGAVVIHERPLPAVTSNFVAKMSPSRGHDSSYLRYVFDHLYSGRVNYPSIKQTTGIQNLDTSQYLAEYFTFPTADEQEQIAAFLDHETAKIDRMIARQERLIELLKEKRQAVISHAVTKGLNPDAPMKDSGVEWLGEVPAHWVTCRAKHLLNFVTSGSRGWAQFYSDQGDLFVRITNLTRDGISVDLSDPQYVLPPKGSEGERSKVRQNDLLISITADLGSVGVAAAEVEGAYVSQHVALARPNLRVTSSRWFGYALISNNSKKQFEASGYGGTKIQLSLEDIREIAVSCPPPEEQVLIANYIDERLSQFDLLIGKVMSGIKLMNEHRTALISAAVTGKIDVRGWQKPDTEPQETAAAVSA